MSFHLFPRAQILGLHLTNKILSGPNSGLWLSLELGDADTQGGSGLVRRSVCVGVGGNLRQTGIWGREVAKRDKLALDNRGPFPPGDN